MEFLYLDPGAGSLLLQILAGGFVAGLVFFKSIWYRIKSVFSSKNKSEKEQND